MDSANIATVDIKLDLKAPKDYFDDQTEDLIVRAFNERINPRVLKEDITTDKISFILNRCCDYKDVWTFESIQENDLIFRAKNSNLKVKIRQNAKSINENFIFDYIRELLGIEKTPEIVKRLKNVYKQTHNLLPYIKAMERKQRTSGEDERLKEIIEIARNIQYHHKG